MFVSIPKAPYFDVKFTDIMSDLKLGKMWRKEILVSVQEGRGSVRAAETGRVFSMTPCHFWKEFFLYIDGQGQPWDIRDDQVVTSGTRYSCFGAAIVLRIESYEKLPPNNGRSGCFSSLSFLSIRN